jgi:hypothetical protein
MRAAERLMPSRRRPGSDASTGCNPTWNLGAAAQALMLAIDIRTCGSAIPTTLYCAFVLTLLRSFRLAHTPDSHGQGRRRHAAGAGGRHPGVLHALGARDGARRGRSALCSGVTGGLNARCFSVYATPALLRSRRLQHRFPLAPAPSLLRSRLWTRSIRCRRCSRSASGRCLSQQSPSSAP